MSFSVTMPALGESVSEGTVTRWLKQEGDEVAVDEPLLEVSTDKVDTEIPSPAAGIVQKIVVAEDETVQVGAELAVIGDASGSEQPARDEAADAARQDQQEREPAQEAEPAEEQAHAEPTEGSAEERAEPPAKAKPDEDAGPEREPAQERASGDTEAAPSAASKGGGTAVTMPALGESVSEGTVTRWLKQVGDEVAVDEPLLEVSTDKVDTEIPSPVAGTLLSIAVNEDETVPVGAELATIGAGSAGSDEPSGGSEPEQGEPEQGEPAPAAAEPDPGGSAAEQAAGPAPSAPASTPAEAEPAEKPSTAPAPAADSAATPAEGKQGVGDGEASPYVTPLVRKLAGEHGVDLAAVAGTGVGGRIRKQDVLAAAETSKAARSAEAVPPSTPDKPAGSSSLASVSAVRGTTEKMSRLRKVIASRMVESLQISAQLTSVVEVDVTRIARVRQRAKADFEAREGVKLSFLPFFAKAAVEALKAFPKLNASVEGDEIVYHSQENLGVAVDTDRGLLVPVIKDAGDLNLAGLSRKIADLAARTRNNKITPDELGGGTFTLTNTGSRGALFDTPIINQPQVAILGTGSVVKRPVVMDDPDLGETIAIRSMVLLALSYDHRLVDGADAARFLGALKKRLEDGGFEGELGL